VHWVPRRWYNKWVWDDCALSPVELVDAIWREVPDFRESYEVAEGLYRRNVPAYDEKVVRELLVNALVHRPYTQQGDIYLNLHPERLELVNPGRLPLGVTPRNMLHASRRRNDGLARIFHDLGLMEREGSGFDLIYDRLLSQGRPAPVPEEEGEDWVKVTIQRRILRPEVMRLLTEGVEARSQASISSAILGIMSKEGSGQTRDGCFRDFVLLPERPSGEQILDTCAPTNKSLSYDNARLKVQSAIGDLMRAITARFKHGVFWVPVDEPKPTGKRQLFEGVE